MQEQNILIVRPENTSASRIEPLLQNNGFKTDVARGLAGVGARGNGNIDGVVFEPGLTDDEKQQIILNLGIDSGRTIDLSVNTNINQFIDNVRGHH